MTRTIGTPTWLDLNCPNLEATKDFYTKLFGWTFEDSGASWNHYNMVSNADGSLVGGAMDTTEMTSPDGAPLPSAWDVFLTVEDIDARLDKAVELGATVLLPATDTGDAGRHALITDSLGATVGLWQPADLAGYEFTGEQGSPVWFEMLATDYDQAVTFYREVFDFEIVPMMDGPEAEFRYATHGAGDSSVCGIQELVEEGVSSHWRVFFGVDDSAAANAKVTESGGSLVDGPYDSPFGRITVITDPSGAKLQLVSMAEAVEEVMPGQVS